MYFAG